MSERLIQLAMLTREEVEALLASVEVALNRLEAVRQVLGPEDRQLRLTLLSLRTHLHEALL